MDEFRIALISIGIFAIVGILAHGMWTIRKNNKLKEEHQNQHDVDLKEPEIQISDDDPLLGGDAFTASKDSSMHRGAESSQQIPPSMKASSVAPKHEETLLPQDEPVEADPLVGDAPLYDSSDLAFTGNSDKAGQNEADDTTLQPPEPQTKQHYDEDGIGSVRVVDDAPVIAPSVTSKDHSAETVDSTAEDEGLPEPPGYLLRKEEPKQHKVSMDNKSIDRLSADEMPMIDTSIDIDESPGGEKRSGALKSEHTRTEVVGGNRLGKKAGSITEKAKKLVGLGPESKGADSKDAPAAKTSKKTKPDPNKDQIRLDLESTPEAEPVSDNTAQNQEEKAAPESEVLILNVRVPEGKVIQGATLLPALLTLGFKFGEHNMFHRHAASNGKGPRLFTLANMFNPGTFDIDNMENFNSTGVSLFMTLPIDADAHQVFNMMHNAARKLADEFGAQVLDGRRSVLTRQSLQQYVEKIREFERRRMIRRG